MIDGARPIRLLSLGGLDPVETQAVYHVVAERMAERDEDTIVVTWPTSPCVCLGYHQIADDVLDREAARRRGLPVVRRRVGGGLTYLDGDQIFYQFIFRHDRVPAVPSKLYAWLLAGPVLALERVGVEASLERENEIEVRGRRIAGVGAARIGEASVVVGNVLRDFPYRAMADVWRVPNEPFRHLATEALHDRVTTLRREGVDADNPRLQAALVDGFRETLGRPLVRGELRADERAALRTSARALTAADFIDLHEDRRGPRKPLKISARAFVHEVEHQRDGMAVHGAMLVEDGRITRVELDSKPWRDWSDVQARLVGRSWERWRDVVGAAL